MFSRILVRASPVSINIAIHRFEMFSMTTEYDLQKRKIQEEI